MLDTELMTKSPQFHTDFWNYLRVPNNATELNLPKQTKIPLLGTFVMPTKSVEKLREKLHELNPLRQIATTMTLDKSHYMLLHYISEPKTVWTDENGYPINEGIAPLDTKQTKISSHQLASFIQVSTSLKEDHSFNLEDYILKTFAKTFSHEECKAFIHGDGINQPIGLLDETRGAKVGHTSSILTMDAILQLYTSVKSEYRVNGTWIMSDDTFLKLRLLKDSLGNYLWTEDTLFGKPVVIVNAMDNATYPIAFGDFSYLWILERFAPTVKVLKELLYLKDQTGYLGYLTLDALLTNRDAIKVLKIEG
ncbi:TPA: phage major capsid protein [Streptococcus suis]|uniref:Phage major capsid protein n=1 Tax=Clostridium perfringens TaxID=1502 RepID=A0AAW9I8Q2_CLOPF|nr:phage major capsid protein [Clostridium perfringens]HEP1807562.1 phage major capsid protein [Streptococcus suis]MBI6027249.1 phage major capsid protein [Clostridium perfringens]MBI6088994.1 phage major capsid protein [Clostridium perfringens]MBI6094458.1 phage major capsid protein [Clostridium perfringens]MDK0906157.1 phage major capsid protein [Clostridium perfringens]